MIRFLQKTTFVVLLALFAAAGLAAQYAGQISLGARLGGSVGFNDPQNFSNWLGQNMWPHYVPPAPQVSHNPQLSFNFAFYGNYAVTGRLSVQAELNFMISQGYDVRLSADGQSLLLDVDYHSLDIPLLLRFNFLSGGPAFGLLAGPHISIPLGRADIYSDTAGAYIDEFVISTGATFGLTAGLFAAVPAGPGRFVGDLRFVFDLNSVQADFHVETRDFMQRRALAITVGYEISF